MGESHQRHIAVLDEGQDLLLLGAGPSGRRRPPTAEAAEPCVQPRNVGLTVVCVVCVLLALWLLSNVARPLEASPIEFVGGTAEAAAAAAGAPGAAAAVAAGAIPAGAAGAARG